jgi:hypothetical protein
MANREAGALARWTTRVGRALSVYRVARSRTRVDCSMIRRGSALAFIRRSWTNSIDGYPSGAQRAVAGGG